MGKCSLHGTTLVNKDVPVSYGMPREETLELFYSWPHHGVFALGGCVIAGDGLDEATVRGLVCDDCHQAMGKALNKLDD